MLTFTFLPLYSQAKDSSHPADRLGGFQLWVQGNMLDNTPTRRKAIWDGPTCREERPIRTPNPPSKKDVHERGRALE